jgi:hypothetical protein
MEQPDSKPFTSAIERVPPAVLTETLDEATSWLARIVLLYGVPFSYLLPEEAMLPKDSIRFFFIDPIWIQSLVQGACSVGSNGYGDTLMDRTMNEWFQPNQPDGTSQVSVTNKKAAEIRDRLRLQYEAATLPPEDAPFPPDYASLNWPLTGFLLRSPVVEGWRGLEVMAYKKLSEENKKSWPRDGLNNEQKKKLEEDDLAPLPALRIEQLSNDVMLGIFNGIIDQLVIRPPQEGLHFGLELNGSSFAKTLRELGYKNPERAGESLPGSEIKDFNKPMRDQDKRVINIYELAENIKTELLKEDQLKDSKLTSAEFAVEMIEAAGEFTFQTNIKTPS